MSKISGTQANLFNDEPKGPVGDFSSKLVMTLKDFDIVYLGELPFDFILANNEVSRTNWITRKKVQTWLGVLEFTQPIVLDTNFKIIDGELRFEAVKELYAQGLYASSTVPVVIYDVTAERAEYLRISLNRMSEFARWEFKADPKELNPTVEDIPEFLDSAPQLQKLLEPLGFWARKLLPDKFFKDTVLYFFEPKTLPIYNPEIGMVEWAKIQTDLNKAGLIETAKSPLKKMKNPVDIYNLQPTEDDFVKTHNIEVEVANYISHMKDIAGVITDAYDVKRRAEKLANNQEWQSSRLSPKKVILEKKARAVASAMDLLDDSFNDELGENDELADVEPDELALEAEILISTTE